MLAISSRLFLARSFNHHAWIFYLFIGLLGCFVPFFGEIIALLIAISLYRKHKQFHEHTEQFDNTINLLNIKPHYAEYGSGGGALQLFDANKSADERTLALFKMAQSPLATMNTMLYQLLPDNSDEMRLLAFSILDEQEGTLSQAIDQLQTMLKHQTLNQETQALLEKNLANLYWDLVYNQLIIHELADSMLTKAEGYALSALNAFPDDAHLWALLGKIYTQLKQDLKAEDAFKKAMSLAIDPAKVMPYLAELYYKRQDYEGVRHALSRAPSLMDISLIAPVKRYWDTK